MTENNFLEWTNQKNENLFYLFSIFTIKPFDLTKI